MPSLMKELLRKHCFLLQANFFIRWCVLTLVAMFQSYTLACTPLYLEVILNHRRLPDIYEFCQEGKIITAKKTMLRGLGISDAVLTTSLQGDTIDLNRIQGINAKYNMLAARITIDAAPDVFNPQHYSLLQQKQTPVSPPLLGLMLDYSLYSSQNSGRQAVNAWSELNMLGSEFWSFSSSQQAVWQQQGPGRIIHLDTRVVRDLPDQDLTLTLGDTLTGAGDQTWIRDNRLTGVQLARNFSLHPQESIVPDASLTGLAVLPSVVDIYIDNIKQNSSHVDPGPFDIQGMPVRNGVNTVQMVVTDITGKRTVQTYDLYGGDELLKTGLTEGSMEVGVVRRNWGEDNFSVSGHPLLSSSFRYGMTNQLTLLSHIEANSRRFMAGSGIHWIPLESVGVVNISLARGQEQGTGGWLWGWGWQRNSDKVSLSLNDIRSQSHFCDLACDEGSLPARHTQTLFAGLNTSMGTPALGIIQREDRDGDSRYLSLSWAWNLNKASFSVTLNRQTDSSHALGGALWLAFPLGSSRNTMLSFANNSDARELTTSLSGRAGDADSINWQVSHRDHGLRAETTMAEVDWLNTHADLSAGISQQHSPLLSTSVYAAASGRVVLVPQGVFLITKGTDAFGLVSTGGAPGIPVQLENNLVGVTNEQGLLLIPDLQSWQENKVSLDTRTIGEQWTLNGPMSKQVTPARHGGSLVAFDVRQNTSAEFQVRDRSGRLLPPGGLVTEADGTPLTQIGFDGLLWLASPRQNAVLTVEKGDSLCRLRLEPQLMKRAYQAKVPVSVVCH